MTAFPGPVQDRTPHRVPRPVAAVLIVVGLVALIGSTALMAPSTPRVVVGNIGSVLLAGAGAWGCLRAAVRSGGRARRGWAALAVACGSWTVGQVIWTVYELALGDALPFPSAADVAYLGFPVAALFGFAWLAPTSASEPLAAPRRFLDALMIGCALGLLAWYVLLDRLAGDSPFLLSLVSLAYPAADLVMITVTVLTLAQTRADPLRWALLGVAMVGMTVSDTLFGFAVDDNTYVTGSFPDWGWAIAFALLGVAGSLVRPGTVTSGVEPRGMAALGGFLPYLPLVAAVMVVVAASTGEGRLDPVGVTLVVVVVVLVLIRQYVTVRENQMLARTLREREVQLNRLAFRDALTGLNNRALFLDRLAHAMDLSARDGRPVSVVFVDLDGFKAVNDTLGHAMGDELLVRVADRLRATIRASDTLARLGGDEFAVLIEDGRPGGEDALIVGRALRDALRAPVSIDGRSVTVSASIGIATADGDVQAGIPGAPADAAALLHRADVAMYAVKNSGKDDVLMHTPMMALDGRNGRTERSMLDSLTTALEHGDIRAVFQPVVDPLSGRIGAFEALARWSLNGTDVPPTAFVGLAEEAGLAENLTAIMLERACEQLAAWSDALGHRRLRVAVNVSPTEFSDDSLPDRIQALLDRHHLYPAQLALEITEGALTNRQATSQDVLFRLREIGVRIALDDFGTGWSTLARLATIPLDTVKIDRFFVADIDHDVRRKRFLVGLFELTRHLGLRTIAEGVERAGQLRELQRLHCDLVQGHYVARPMSAAELTPLVLAEMPIIPQQLLGVPQQAVRGTEGAGVAGVRHI